MSQAVGHDLIPFVNRFRQIDSDFKVYLNSAAESLFLNSHTEAFAVYAACKALGSEGRSQLANIENETRSLVAHLISAPVADVVFLSSTSRGLDAAIKSIHWRKGDNIVFSDTEFLTTEYAGALLKESSIEVKIVQSSDGFVSVENYANQIDARTRLVVASSVSFKSGVIMDIPSLSDVVHANGALLFVDAIQGLGSVPTSVAGADFLCSGTFKWLFGMHGISIFYVNPAIYDQLQAPYVGYHSVIDMFASDRLDRFRVWPDARRYQEGLPNYVGICVLNNSLKLISEIGLGLITKHNKSLTDQLLIGLQELGIKPLGAEVAEFHAPIVSFETSDFERICKQLRELGTVVWARDGRVRMSPHFYNSESDISVFLSQLQTLV
jgi:cysteine desulfurase/selenocysteine lyase